MSGLALVSFPVERGIPMPPPCRGAAPKYPWRGMEVGESFFVASTPALMSVTRSRVRSAGYGQQITHGTRFTVRKVDGGFRVWRLA